MRRNMYKCLLLCLSYLCFFNSSYSQELDLTFGSGTGKIIIPILNEDHCNAIVIQQDGKIALGGYSTGTGLDIGFSVARVNLDGSTDNTFNSNGTKVLNVTTQGSRCTSIKIDANNKIVTGGYVFDSNKSYYGLVSFNSDGSLNTNFNSTGIDTFSVGTTGDFSTSFAIQTDNKIVMSGYSNNSLISEISCSRLNSNGTLDNSFNTTGKLLINPSNDGQANSILIQPNGKVLLGGTYNGNFIVIRLNTDGSFDNSFGSAGQIQVDFGTTQDAAYSLALQKDGKILIAGTSNNQFAIARLNSSDGSLDNTFGTNLNGTVNIPMGTYTNKCNAVAIDTFATPNKIIMIGYVVYNGGVKSDFATARLDLSGNIEAKSTISIGSAGSAIATSVVIQSDSKIVVAGYANNGTDDDFAVIRLLPDFLTTAVTEPENIINTGVNVFPNPASYQLNVHSSYNISGIVLYNTLGETVISTTNNNDMSAVIDISALNKGIYTAVIVTDKGNAVKKVVKQ